MKNDGHQRDKSELQISAIYFCIINDTQTFNLLTLVQKF